MSLTARITLLFAGLTATLLVSAGLVLGEMLDRHFRELDLHELRGKLALIQHILEREGPTDSMSDHFERLEDSFIGHDNIGVRLKDDDGRLLYVIHPQHFDENQGAAAIDPNGVLSWSVGGRPYVGLESRIVLQPARGAPKAMRILAALNVAPHDHFLASIGLGLWVGIATAVILAAILGWFAAHRGLAPLRRVIDAARGLSADRLDSQLSEEGAPPEVRELVDAFNGMMKRLQAAFRRLSDFSADIAHELRTPISNLMTQTAVALSRPRSAADYRDILSSNLEEYERIARMVSDMLFLAKAEQHTLPHDSEIVDLANEAHALIDFYEALAEEHQVRVICHGQGAVRGDRLMLRRALSNLLSNALRHTPANGLIEVTIETRSDAINIAVRNIGDPIAPDQLRQIFERFHRGTNKREHHGEGAGLGLAITRSIVQAHGGKIYAESAHGITTFTVTLPALQEHPQG